MELLDVSFSEKYFDFDLKNNNMVLWTDNLIGDTVHGISWGEMVLKMFTTFRAIWMSMAAILVSLFS
jgi:hypothetical protein